MATRKQFRRRLTNLKAAWEAEGASRYGYKKGVVTPGSTAARTTRPYRRTVQEWVDSHGWGHRTRSDAVRASEQGFLPRIQRVPV